MLSTTAKGDLINELEARDVVFRVDLDTMQQRQKAPWIATFGKGDLEKEDESLWQKVFDGQITEEFALDAMTDLMERYYGKRYSLDRAWRKKGPNNAPEGMPRSARQQPSRRNFRAPYYKHGGRENGT